MIPTGLYEVNKALLIGKFAYKLTHYPVSFLCF